MSPIPYTHKYYRKKMDSQIRRNWPVIQIELKKKAEDERQRQLLRGLVNLQQQPIPRNTYQQLPL